MPLVDKLPFPAPKPAGNIAGGRNAPGVGGASAPPKPHAVPAPAAAPAPAATAIEPRPAPTASQPSLLLWLLILALAFLALSPAGRRWAADHLVWSVPVPAPTPVPSPTPSRTITSPLFAAVIRDKAKGEGAEFVATAGTLRKDLLALNVGWRNLDIDEPLGKALLADPEVSGVPLPVLVVTDDAHAVVLAKPCPADASGVVAEIKTLRGGN